MKNDKIDNFLDKKLLSSPSTRRNYRMNIQSYFKLLNKDMNTYFEDAYIKNEKGEKVLNGRYDDDLIKIHQIQKEKGRPDLSTRTYFNSVKQFMVSNNKDFKDIEFWDILKARTRGAEPDSDEAILNANDIKTILAHGNACSRALFLMLCSSGRRISEILALTPDDINIEVSPATINIKKGLDRNTTKTKQKTLCYISDEATTAYNTWMKERDEYLKTALKRNTHKKDENDPRIFPMSYHNALVIWKTLLMKAALVDIEHYKNKWTGRMSRRIKKKHKGDRLLQHPHCLRKFYRSYLGDADFAEYMMGHSTMLTRAYRQMKPEDKAATYQKLMPNVTIFETTSKDIVDLNSRMQEKDTKLKDMEKNMEEMKRDLKMAQLEIQIMKHEGQINGKKKK